MSPFWRGVALRYARWRVRNGLDGLFIHGLEHARDAVSRGPVTMAATHVSWWDGLLMAILDDELKTDPRFIMDARNLAKIPMFRAIGAIGIDRSSGARARDGLLTASDHLSAPGSAVWIFPQGRQRPRHIQPLGLHAGALALARQDRSRVVPITLGYGFRESHLPTGVVTIAPALPAGASLDDLEAVYWQGIARTDAFLDGQTDGFDVLIPSKQRTEHVGLGSKILAWSSRE